MALSARFGAFFARPPYDRPCDDDAVDDPPTRRALVYGGLPCRGSAFPERTTLIVFMDWADGDDFDRPIRAIAWLGGSYFETRSTFPVRIGEPAMRATAVFGEPVASFEISQKAPLVAWSFAGDIHAVIDRSLIAGFVIGPMPADGTKGDWEVVAEMYLEATPKKSVGTGQVSRETCRDVLEHTDRLIGQDPAHPRDPAKREREIDECVDHATPAAAACALAARAMEELEACGAE